jgi:tetratricopeptide (TPR) repeat protein
MSSPIKGPAPKRFSSEREEIEVISSPQISPRKPIRSPKKPRTLTSSINGLPVEKQDLSPYKSPSKTISQTHLPTASYPRRNLIHAFDAAEKEPPRSSLLNSLVSVEEEILNEAVVLQTPSSPKTEIIPSILEEPKPAAAKPALRVINLFSLLTKREENARSFLPLDVEAWSREASNLNEKGNQTEAFRAWELAASGAYHMPKRQKEILVSLAIQQLEAGQYRDAILNCEVIDSLFPQDLTPALLIRGLCHLKLKNYEKCYQSFMEAIKKDESQSEEEQKRISEDEWKIYYNLIEKSIHSLQIAKQDVAGNRDLILNFLELIYELQCANDKIQEALSTLEEQEEMLPGSTLMAQAFCYHYLELYEESLEFFKSTLQRRHEIPLPSFINLISAAAALKSMDQSDADILELSKEYCSWALLEAAEKEEQEEALTMKYDCQFFLKQYWDAIATAQTLRALNPKSPSYLISQAFCYFKLEHAEEGTRLLEKALQFKESLQTLDREILNDCVMALNFARQYTLAEQYLEWAGALKTSK